MASPTLSSVLHTILILATANAVLSESSAFNKTAHHGQTPTLLPSSRQISPQVLSCDSSDPIIRGICNVTLEVVNPELEAANIAIRKDGVLFTYDDPNDFGVPTGHSCSVTAAVRHQHASAHFSGSSTLRLLGNSISDKTAIHTQVPVRVNARVEVRQRFGFRFFGKCKRLGRDTFSLNAGADARTDAVVGVALNPSFRTLSDGNLELTLMPAVAVLFDLKDLDLKFRASGVSPITPVLTWVLGFKTVLLRSVTRLFQGDSLKSVLKDLTRSVIYDFTATVVLGIGALPRPLEALIFDALSNIAKRKVERKAEGYVESWEDKLNEEVRSALKVGPDGKRVFVIKGNFLELQRASASSKDLFVGPPSTVTPRPNSSRRSYSSGGRRVYTPRRAGGPRSSGNRRVYSTGAYRRAR